MEEKKNEIVKVPVKMEFNQNLSWGRISRFVAELRDNKRIMGAKCPKCGTVWCPPIADCIKCFVPNDWVEVGPQGIIQTYTIAYMPPAWAMDLEIPYAIALIKLDGADTGMLHYVKDLDVKEVKIGLRVEAVFKDKREGRITDISHFKPCA